MKALVVVAHPDDETMFCGGTITKLKWDWTIVSAAHTLNSPRGQEFSNACKLLQAKPLMLGVKYGGKNSQIPISQTEVTQKLLSLLSIEDYDVILTHNGNGEFRNKDHIVIHKVIKNFSNQHIWYFGFNEIETDFCINLGMREREIKKQALLQYKSQAGRINLIEIRREEAYLLS